MGIKPREKDSRLFEAIMSWYDKIIANRHNVQKKYVVANDNQRLTFLTLSQYKWMVHHIATADLKVFGEAWAEFARVTFALLEGLEVVFSSQETVISFDE